MCVRSAKASFGVSWMALVRIAAGRNQSHLRAFAERELSEAQRRQCDLVEDALASGRRTVSGSSRSSSRSSSRQMAASAISPSSEPTAEAAPLIGEEDTLLVVAQFQQMAVVGDNHSGHAIARCGETVSRRGYQAAAIEFWPTRVPFWLDITLCVPGLEAIAHYFRTASPPMLPSRAGELHPHREYAPANSSLAPWDQSAKPSARSSSSC